MNGFLLKITRTKESWEHIYCVNKTVQQSADALQHGQRKRFNPLI
jgi:hypothetical protein